MWNRWKVLALGMAIFLVFGASMVAAGVVVVTGQANNLAVVKTVSSNSIQTTESTDWVDVSGAVRRATSTGTGNLFWVLFTAETSCFEANGGGSPSNESSLLEIEVAACLARIVVKDTAGSQVAIMNPVDDVANLDSIVFGGGSTIQGHAMSRSISLGSGTYDFQVQIRVGEEGLGFLVDDWHYTLTRYTP